MLFVVRLRERTASGTTTRPSSLHRRILILLNLQCDERLIQRLPSRVVVPYLQQIQQFLNFPHVGSKPIHEGIVILGQVSYMAKFSYIAKFS